jgi:hypothetical protein
MKGSAGGERCFGVRVFGVRVASNHFDSIGRG